jgi:hypothetical protein
LFATCEPEGCDRHGRHVYQAELDAAVAA